MSAITQVPFYPSDWLSGTRGMTAAETGIYITLIALMYEQCGPINDDRSRLARLCGASNSTFSSAVSMLIGSGKITEKDGHLFNDKVEKILTYVLEKSEVARSKAKSRWSKSIEKSMGEECSSIAPEMQAKSHKSKDISSLRSDSAPKESASPKASKKAKIKTRIEPDFLPNETGISKAKSAGMDKDSYRREVQRFRDYHAANGSLMLDWQAAWRTWCGNFENFSSRSRSPPSGRTSQHDQIAEFERTMRGYPDDQFSGTTIDGAAHPERRDADLEAVQMLPGLPQ